MTPIVSKLKGEKVFSVALYMLRQTLCRLAPPLPFPSSLSLFHWRSSSSELFCVHCTDRSVPGTHVRGRSSANHRGTGQGIEAWKHNFYHVSLLRIMYGGMESFFLGHFELQPWILGVLGTYSCKNVPLNIPSLLFVRPHVTAWELLNGSSWIVIFKSFNKICRRIPVLIKIGRQWRDFSRQPTFFSARGSNWLGSLQATFATIVKFVVMVTLPRFWRKRQNCFAVRTFPNLSSVRIRKVLSVENYFKKSHPFFNSASKCLSHTSLIFSISSWYKIVK
jgi:hypothetical protein